MHNMYSSLIADSCFTDNIRTSYRPFFYIFKRRRPIMANKDHRFLCNKLDDTKLIIKQAEHHDDKGYNVVTDIIKHSSRWVS